MIPMDLSLLSRYHNTIILQKIYLQIFLTVLKCEVAYQLILVSAIQLLLIYIYYK